MAQAFRQVVRRGLFQILIVLSLLLCLAIMVMYIRAFTRRDQVRTSIFRHDCIMATFPHHVHLLVAHQATDSQYPTRLTYGLYQYPPKSKYLQPRLSSTGVYWEISVPFWLPLLFAIATPLWVASRAWRRRRRRLVGLCPVCGYDLRATPERCPECGLVITNTQTRNPTQ